MSLSIFATQASPAVAGPADSSPEVGAESSQSFSTVLQQEGRRDSAGQTDVVSGEKVGNDEAAGDATPLAASEEAVAALASVLLGSIPTSPEALPDDVQSKVPEDFPEVLGEVPALLNSAFIALSSVGSINNEAGSQSGMAVSESQLLPPGGKTLPTWTTLLNAALTSNSDSNVAVTPAANDPIAEGLKADAELSAALAGSADSKAFQTLLRSDPMLATLVSDARNSLDNFNGSAGSALIDASLPNMVDTARLGASNTATPANQTGAELVPGLPLRSPAFGTLLANQVLWQAKVGNNEAAIRLDPPELGPIDVRISQVDNETHLHFTAGHGLTRDQLEQSIPRLRELFSQGGLSLGQVFVEQGSRDNASQREGSNGRQNTANTHSNTASDNLPTSVRLLNGLIDDYA